MSLQSISRAYVSAVLRVARVPFDLAERLAGHQGDETWPPALAYDGFEAGVKQVLGSIGRDEELVRQARLQQTRVAELRDAVRLETIAEQTRSEADETFQSRRQADAQKRDEVAERAERRETEAENRRREAKTKADAKAREQAAQARKVEQDRKRVLAKNERAAKTATITKERAAISKAKVAAEKKADVRATDKKISSSRAARRSA